MNMLLKNKLIHYELNLDYNYCDIEQQTNILITYITNEFINLFKKDFDSKIFVYEFNDDLPSLLGYILLTNIQSINENFNYVLTNKPRKTKNFFQKKEQIYSKRKIKKNKDNIIYISNFNSVYKVLNLKRKSINFIPSSYNIIEKFTIAEMLTALYNFYNIPEIKGFTIETNNELSDYDMFLSDIDSLFDQSIFPLCADTPKFSLVWLTNKVEEDIKILQEIEQTDDVVLYFYKDKKPEILKDLNFNLVIKKKTNRPSKYYLNDNQEILLRAALQDEIVKLEDLKLVGNWPNEEWNKLRRTITG